MANNVDIGKDISNYEDIAEMMLNLTNDELRTVFFYFLGYNHKDECVLNLMRMAIEDNVERFMK